MLRSAGMTTLPIAPIDHRKQIILKAVVTDYVRTAEPVGSHTLMTQYSLGVKSATIRNEMAELSEMGYLRQPHTSAGRVPSDMGYRLYVDRLMEAGGIACAEAAQVRRKLAARRAEVDVILEQTCRVLSDLAHHASVATHPMIKDAHVSHISVARVGRDKLLAVLVLDNGRVLHEFIQSDLGGIDPVVATNYLMEKLAGLTLESATAIEALPQESPQFRGLLSAVVEFVRREFESVEETDITTEGAGYIVQQPEFRDATRLEAILSILEQRRALYRLFSSVMTSSARGVTVVIGRENPLEEMRDCSFVGARYRIHDRPAGTIGVLGPTRMDYPRAVSAVDFMARSLGEILTALSVA